MFFFLIPCINLGCSYQEDSLLATTTPYIKDSTLSEQIIVQEDAISKLNRLKSKYKFGFEEQSEDFPLGYVGIQPEEFRPLANSTLNTSISNLLELCIRTPYPTKDQILQEFNRGLNSFNDIAVDTEDRERVCYYYQEIMDIISLESSNELLNNWLYH